MGPLLSFGANVSASNFFYTLARGSDSLLIGRFYGPESVGLYSRAAALLYRPLDQFLTPIDAVFVPVLSRLQFERDTVKDVHLLSSFLEDFADVICFKYVHVWLRG